MVRYFLKRLGMMLVALFMIILLTFVIEHSIPGGPFTSDRKVTPEVEAALNEKYHLNDPLPKQFLDYLVGNPARRSADHPTNIRVRRSRTLFLTVFRYLPKLGGITSHYSLCWLLLPHGYILAAVKNGKWQDMLVMGIATIGVTIPSFVIASILIYVFSFRLNWLPTFGLDSWKGYVLPVITLGGYSVSYLARQMRSSLLEVMGQDYIRTARAKGLVRDERSFSNMHLRNALIPVITVLGPTIANLLTGSFVVEQIFAIPGLGVHFVNSVSQRDYTTIMGVTVFYAAFLLAMVFLVDIFYCLIDPRIKYD